MRQESNLKTWDPIHLIRPTTIYIHFKLLDRSSKKYFLTSITMVTFESFVTKLSSISVSVSLKQPNHHLLTSLFSKNCDLVGFVQSLDHNNHIEFEHNVS